MKRETIEVILETSEEDGVPERKFILPSGFKNRRIIVWEDPFDLKVSYDVIHSKTSKDKS